MLRRLSTFAPKEQNFIYKIEQFAYNVPVIMRYKKILFFKPGAIGDLLHTLPSIKALRQAYPAANITVVVSPGLDLLIQETPLADRIIVFDKQRIKKSMGDFFAFAKDLRRERYDLFVDMQPSLRSMLLRWFSGASNSVVYRKQKQVKRGETRLHAVQNFLKTLAPLGIADHSDRIELPIRPDAAATVSKFLAEQGISADKPIIALNCSVGPARPSRNWFSDRFAVLADRLISELGTEVIFVGGREDRELVDRVIATMGRRAVSVAGKLTLPETAALLARCRCLVSSDTGPLHLATSVQTPVVGLYGSTDPLRTGPVGAGHHVLQKKLSCVPCEQKECPLSTHACMAAITVDDVFTSVKDIMQCH